MEFGPVPPADAEGTILAHSLTAGDKRLKKGRILSAADILALRESKIPEITVCRLGPEDIAEDAAADRLAEASMGAGLIRAAAFTGRVNLSAEDDGILLYDPIALDQLNSVDEGITLAALPPFSRVSARQMVATAKIIPFGVPSDALDRACPAEPLLRLAAFQPARAVLIQTNLPGLKSSILDKTEAVLAARAMRLGAEVMPPLRVPHHIDALATSLETALGIPNPEIPTIITIVGASAIVDRRDVIPAAIEAAGGRIEHFGMPVDPGNLLLLGSIGETPVIGAPGCVRSPQLNGYDWVLERLVARIPITRAAIMAMGSGGFLKEIASRPLPRAETATRPPDHAPRLHGVLLAAGQSRRMGRRNKLLEEIDGDAMIRRAAQTALASGIEQLTVVTGHQAAAVRERLDGLSVRFVACATYAQGLAESLKSGIAALPSEADGALICLGDMPRLKSATLTQLLGAFDPIEGRSICVPVHNGKRGNPVLFAKRFFTEILDLSGDSGAKSLLGAYPENVVEVIVDDPGILLDLDTPEALSAARDSSHS